MRGFLEFCGSSFLLLALKIALDNNMNQGISTAMMTLAGLMITLLSWCIYGEKLNVAHVIGMFLILGAIIVMGVFQKQTEWENLEEVEDSSSDKAMLKVVGVGVLAALSFSFEAITIKWLLGRGVDGPHGGYVALLFDGIFSLILLTTVTCMGDGIQTVPFFEQIEIISGGCCTSLALICVNYGVANGISGIAFSCANSFPVWHVLFSWLALGQSISPGQLVGVGMAVIGGFVLSVNEFIMKCLGCEA